MLATPSKDQLLPAESMKDFSGIIMDIRTLESYEEGHIEGAQNFSVYQTDFLQKVPESFPDKTLELLVYGDGGNFKADQAALGRLQFLGYTNVSLLEGGLSSWKAMGMPVVGTGEADAVQPLAGEFLLDTERTRIRWVGRNLMNQHNGEVKASGGHFTVSADGIFSSGLVTVDMTQISCQDIIEKPLAKMLIEHLESADFFDAGNHPTASFELKQAEPIADASYGKPNYAVKGDFSARGKTIELEIDALIEPIEGGYVFQSVFQFDRTQVGALYGSGCIFERLGMHLVNDNVSLDIAAFFTQTA